MRFGLVLQPVRGIDLAPLAEQAGHAEAHGFDLAWLEETHGSPAAIPSPFVVVAALAPLVGAIRFGVTVDVGASHPLYVAEESAATDQASGGRLVTTLRPASGAEDRYAEAVDVIQAGQAPRPFRHEGRSWRIPANLPENRFNIEERVRVTPPPAQIEPALWLTGAGAPAAARERALSYLAGADEGADDLAREWRQAQAHLGAGVARLRRPAVRAVDVEADGSFDDEGLVERLRAERAAWGLDVVVLRLPEALGQDSRLRAVEQLGSLVWPRVQLDRLPFGLEDEWRARRAAR